MVSGIARFAWAQRKRPTQGCVTRLAGVLDKVPSIAIRLIRISEIKVVELLELRIRMADPANM
jgi:hypothetical protein